MSPLNNPLRGLFRIKMQLRRIPVLAEVTDRDEHPQLRRATETDHVDRAFAPFELPEFQAPFVDRTLTGAGWRYL